MRIIALLLVLSTLAACEGRPGAGLAPVSGPTLSIGGGIGAYGAVTR